jgi:hypothetical protein
MLPVLPGVLAHGSSHAHRPVLMDPAGNPGPVPKGTREVVCTAPFVGPTTVEDIAFYGAVGAVALLRWVSWPTALLIAAAHALHQRARITPGERLVEAIEGVAEAAEEAV